MSTEPNNRIAGIVFILFGMLAISINDTLIKFLSGGYPLHQMVFTRSVIGIVFSLALVQMEGGWRILKTATPGLHFLRAMMLVVANLCFFVALASLTQAEVTAIFFAAPLMITLLSIPMLGEKVGPLRIGAVIVGFIGVIIVASPWQTGAARVTPFYVYTLPLIGACFYATTQVLTRKLGVTSKASALAIYVQANFIIVCACFYFIAGDGRFAEGLESQSLIFLLRPWVVPTGNDIWLFAGLGMASAVVGYTMAQAYRLSDAATVAPFEYVGLPLAIFWGFVVFGELPTPVMMAGIVLILGSGLFVFLRERQKGRKILRAKRVHRRY
ncbi:DMT family transporter [Roseovarius sp. LXJ103]|uniref:DMT family transporter n=1 Tax=Roseovarius carneus TaxID=2853164 RepID=UPI000D61E41F|nr:DMT family transporter [Roseovarius carneus]MBZ8118460.1 DMT family transporter [Roseovarius carneus]PWE35840.1 hypothetical protein DD563_07635 [Pelagicola sp. LXJ1103]